MAKFFRTQQFGQEFESSFYDDDVYWYRQNDSNNKENMSDEESTSIQISATCSNVGNEHNLKPHKYEQWEIEMIGNFLLTLYHRVVIGPQNEWVCMQSDIQREFEHFMTSELSKRLQEFNATDNIGSLLHRCGFLLNPPADGPFYKLKSEAILEYHNKKLMEQDERRTEHDVHLDNIVERVFSVLIDSTKHKDYDKHDLHYRGTKMQKRRPNDLPANRSCAICQQNFATMDCYKEHIKIHNNEKEFEYLKELTQFESPIFAVSYRLCKHSRHFCFTIESQTNNLVIEKIIIVQSHKMSYVNNKSVPYDMPTSGRELFYLDSHLFERFAEQPIVLVCHLKGSKDTRIIEEHHYMPIPKCSDKKSGILIEQETTSKPDFDIPEYLPPSEIYDALKDAFFCDKLMETSDVFRHYVENGKCLKPQTMGPTLTTLLQIEDMYTLKDYFNLFQYNVEFHRSYVNDEYKMSMELPSDLASFYFCMSPHQRNYIENVVSVHDDIIITTRRDIRQVDVEKFILQKSEDINRFAAFVGQIDGISGDRITFKCNDGLDLNHKYTIIFRPSRMPFRYQYQALTLLPAVMPFLEKFLFPEELLAKPLPTLSLDLYNKSIYNNPDQLQAVLNIAEGPRNDAAYIIFGPPGTGKTTTLVESILQVLKRDGTKILVTASSNSACDEVALRLCKALDESIVTSSVLVRIFSKSSVARIDTIDDLLLEHSNIYSGHFYPHTSDLHQYRIVVCTMAVVAILYTGAHQPGDKSYTHMFIDEVAASTEVESLMAITAILTTKACLIIAGDHKQLGPVLKSKRAEEFNLGVSLMDRLLARECYRVNSDTGDYDRTIQSRLRQNFRSHPEIVNLYSDMYYNRELMAKANVDDVALVKHWHLAPSKDFPIIFHSIDAKSCSDKRSFSLYNLDEIDVVMNYVKDLMYFGINGKPVRECDIGVISPYKKQYLRIRKELQLRKWYKIETGSVEIFQGQEKEIIIVSFVRSGTSTLGFLESPRRLNVTLSRAKSLLVLIGNAKTLSMNRDYGRIITKCQEHKTFIDSPLSAGHSGDFKCDRRGYNGHQPRKDTENNIHMITTNLRNFKLGNFKDRQRGHGGGSENNYNWRTPNNNNWRK